LGALFLTAFRLLALLVVAKLFFPAAVLELFFAPALLRAAFLKAVLEVAFVVFFALALERVDVLAFFDAPLFFAALAVPDAEAGDPSDLLLLARERPCLPAWLAAAVSALTSLLKLLFWPPAVSSWYTSAKPRSSNFSKNPSHEIGSRLPSPL